MWSVWPIRLASGWAPWDPQMPTSWSILPLCPCKGDRPWACKCVAECSQGHKGSQIRKFDILRSQRTQPKAIQIVYTCPHLLIFKLVSLCVSVSFVCNWQRSTSPQSIDTAMKLLRINSQCIMDSWLSQKRHYYYFQTHAAGLNHYVIWKAITANYNSACPTTGCSSETNGWLASYIPKEDHQLWLPDANWIRLGLFRLSSS